ncbi:MAG TPA: DUF3224 domain-containing protein [Steroidobacteraceae bacterium]|nr:DUF3224 domain-containing protein [Steroidobacteraceae bacterium]
MTGRRKYRAAGSFTVTIRPLQKPEITPGSSLGRMALEKQFVGDLVASGKGEMLTAMTDIAGSAAYVAIERVSGVLQGRRGGFVFQHSGTMTHGVQRLSITVVPDSGVDKLAGIDGSFTINIVDGQHFYEFEYSLPAEPG